MKGHTMKAAKFVVAVLGSAITAAAGLGLTGRWQQILTVAAAAITAVAVYATPNKPAAV